MSGDVVACRAVRQAVERHERDIEASQSDDFPYYFHVGEALKACEFFPILLKHSIGSCAGLPFNLEPWQAFGVWSIFGWKRKCDDSRRFRKFFWSMARKNGKSTLGAGIAQLLAMFDHNPVTGKPEEVAEVILCATKKEQAEQVIYAEIKRMRERSAKIKSLSSDVRGQIEFPANKGKIRCVGSDRPYDGLNPHAVLMDELHAWREHHRPFYETMQTGSGFRTQPLIGTLTTAGTDKSHLWLEEYRYAKSVLAGTAEDNELFAFIFELDEEDDCFDESLWIKANPNLGISVNADYIHQIAKEAKAAPTKEAMLNRYHCNRLTSSNERPFDLDAFNQCAGELSDWKEASAIGVGVDLGGRDDLAAYCMCARFETGEEDEEGVPVYRYEFRARSYIATSSKRDVSKAPFAGFVHTGLIERCQYPINRLEEDLLADCEDYLVYAIAFDPYNAMQLGDRLEERGLNAARMSQTYTQFNEPILDFINMVESGRVRHEGRGLLEWCAGNAMIVRDRNDRVMFDKRESDEKIDPLVAAVMAFRMASKAPEASRGSLFVC